MRGRACFAVLIFTILLIPNLAQASPSSQIGVFRPGTGQWFIDYESNLAWDGCETDQCFSKFGAPGDQPVCGDWTGSGAVRIGTYRPNTGQWFFDLDGGGAWDGCQSDRCFSQFGISGDLAVAGDIDNDGIDEIGVYRPTTGKWYFDVNGNGLWEGCTTDRCWGPFGLSGDLPVLGDWTGTGFFRIGVFRPSSGQWYQDLNGDGLWSGCGSDGCYGPFGLPQDRPIAGDWNGTGASKSGVYRPDKGLWYIDLNGNYKWDGCALDACGQFGTSKDLPVAGNWVLISPPDSGNHLSLNGEDGVVVHQAGINPSASSLDLTTFTIEAWVYPTANRDMLIAADSAYYLMIRQQVSDQPLRVEFAVLTYTGFPAFRSFVGNLRPLQLNQWNHVVGMVNNSTAQLWVGVNGELSNPQLFSGGVDTRPTQTFSLGNSYPKVLGDFPFIGRIDEVRLSSVVRYNKNFGMPYVFSPDAETVGLWHFDETAGSTTFMDSSGNDYLLSGLNGASTVVGSRDAVNTAPTAYAGPDKNYLTGITIYLDGSNSADLDGDALSFSWNLISKPVLSGASLNGANSEIASFMADVDGVYEFSLIVNDGLIDSETDVITITAITPGDPTAPLADTGQTTSYTTIFGEDSDYTYIPMSFTDNADGTVTDNVTGLLWQKGSVSNYNWFEATGTPDVVYNPGGAIDVCGSLSLGGVNNWRVPTKKELVAITNYGTYSPAIDTEYFPDTQNSLASGYWSATTYSGDYCWVWGGLDGRVLIADKTSKTSFNNVRCVSGVIHGQNFLENGDGTITDLGTGLTWQKEDDGVGRSWENAIVYCENLSFAGYEDWRMPDIKELQSITNESLNGPAIDSNYFKNTSSSIYWSSTTRAYTPTFTLGVDFNMGSIGSSSFTEKYDSNLVRCVR